MKRQSFRASHGKGGETEFRQGLRVENGTTNLLSLIISLNYERSKVPRFAREGENWIQTRNKSREWYNESSSFSKKFMKHQSFCASRVMGGGGGGQRDARIWIFDIFSFILVINNTFTKYILCSNFCSIASLSSRIVKLENYFFGQEASMKMSTNCIT